MYVQFFNIIQYIALQMSLKIKSETYRDMTNEYKTLTYCILM